MVLCRDGGMIAMALREFGAESTYAAFPSPAVADADELGDVIPRLGHGGDGLGLRKCCTGELLLVAGDVTAYGRRYC